MIRTFTQDELIKYIYHETTEEENKEIRKALLCDAELETKFKELLGAIKKLDEVTVSPSDKTITNILNYSKSLNLLSNK